MDRMGSFPVMTEEQYQQALQEYSFFRISYQVQLYRISRIDAPTELLNAALTSSATRQAPAKDLVEALVASLAKYKDATALVVCVQEDKVIYPLWWERLVPTAIVEKAWIKKLKNRQLIGFFLLVVSLITIVVLSRWQQTREEKRQQEHPATQQQTVPK